MSSRIVQAWAARLPSRRGFPTWLLAAAVVCGCAGSAKPPPSAEVSGQVLFKGKPLPGGVITFVTVKGGFSSGGDIDENGNYKVTVPVGEVKITVSNQMLNKGRGVPQAGPMLKNPNAPQPKEMKGKYVALPSKYANADQTDLTYTVVPGAQTHEVTLN